MQNLTPREIVKELDRYIIGQDDAKKSVAIALRNRYRRANVSASMRDEIYPKNILMMGPTGVGKTEIARRLAKVVYAPFVKVEATKFTEVGYVGRDVESMIRDLAENSYRMVKQEHQERVKEKAKENAEERLISILCSPIQPKKVQNPIDMLLGTMKKEPEKSEEEKAIISSKRSEIEKQLKDGLLENKYIDIEVKERPAEVEVGGNSIAIGDMMGGILPERTKIRHLRLSEARKILTEEEAQKLIDNDSIKEEAIKRAEEHGIVFIDEIDKIAGKSSSSGPDISREGVQRDILPIVEGSIVNTKYGSIKTDYILFIAAGAFHIAKPSDLIPELQGRFPVHVTLKNLSEEDFLNILSQPDNALTRQYKALLEVDKVHIHFEDDALKAIAKAAYNANNESEDIGARRLHAIFEELLEDISFNAGGDSMPEIELNISENYVKEHLHSNQKLDVKKYIL